MRDFLLVLKFELQTMVRKKSFLISTVLVAAAAFVLLSIPRVFSDDKGTDDSASEKDKTMPVSYTHLEHQGTEITGCLKAAVHTA